MCDCKDVEMGSYTNQILLGYYPVMMEYRQKRISAGLSGDMGIPVDKCIVDQVIALWENGVRTYGCCCGHNKQRGFINVGKEDFKKALGLGFTKHEFENDPDRCDTVNTKEII